MVYKMGPCGYDGGSAVDMNMNGVNRIVSIRVNAGAAIDSVTILFERNGLQEWTPRWGGGGGSSYEIVLGANEYLTSVEGHVGKFDGLILVKSLKFISNLRSFGPYGREEGLFFTLPAAGGKILGFHGRCGGYLDALGTYVV